MGSRSTSSGTLAVGGGLSRRVRGILGLVALVLAGCTAGQSPSGDAAGSPFEDMTASISRDDFVAEANAICARGTEEIEGSSVRPGTRQFIVEVVVPGIRQQLADIRELGFPEGDEETIEGILSDAEAVLDQTESDPESVGPDPFADVNERMVEYGLFECA